MKPLSDETVKAILKDDFATAVSDETVKAILKDDFATAVIRAARDLLYMEHRDWSKICPDGRIPFDCDMVMTAWYALGTLINADPTKDLPQDGKVNVSGVMMPIAAIHELDAAFRKKPLELSLTNPQT